MSNTNSDLRVLYVSVIAKRRSTATTIHSVHMLRYGLEGPARQMEWFICKLAEGATSDWSFSVVQITGFEYEAFLRRQKAEEVLA